jgi:hypothetical protein
MDPAEKLRTEMQDIMNHEESLLEKVNLKKTFDSIQKYISIADRLYVDNNSKGKWIKK